jgi:hypothetical protein
MQESFVISYESRKLREHEKNYANHDLELVIIVHALNKWRNYLLGRRFELRVEHMSLKYLFDQLSLNARKARWLKFLCEFDFEITHVKGKENKVGDALSKKFHISALSMCKSYLRTKVLESLNKDELYLQLKEKLWQDKLDK